jgi:hypothetical protein
VHVQLLNRTLHLELQPKVASSWMLRVNGAQPEQPVVEGAVQ